MSATYVRWDDDLRAAFNRLCAREGFSAAARALHMCERHLNYYRKGQSTGGATGAVRPRKFLSLNVLVRLADALDDLELENREALTQREWSDRGEWAYFVETA
jgi:hypothetical protein